MKEKRYYKFGEFSEDLFEQIDVAIIGICKEDRSSHIPKLLIGKVRRLITIEYDIEREKYEIYDLGKIVKAESDISDSGKDLLPNILDDLELLELDGKNVLIESTSLSHPILFYLIKVFKENFNLQKFFVTYCEPEKYVQNDDTPINRRFDLTEKFCNRSSLPGFLRLSGQENERTLVTIMGFEGNRFSKTYEEVNPAAYKTYAIVGFPSYQPSWQYYVYSQNKGVLETSKAHGCLDRVTAYDPFGVYNALKRIVESENKNEIVVAPLGTKPHSIGSCMFAIDYEDIQLHYDYPFLGKKIRTEGIGNSYLYNLSAFVNE